MVNLDDIDCFYYDSDKKELNIDWSNTKHSTIDNVSEEQYEDFRERLLNRNMI